METADAKGTPPADVSAPGCADREPVPWTPRGREQEMPEPRIGSLHTDLPKEEEERLRSALARLLKGSPDAGGAPMEVEGEIRRREKGVVCRLSSRYEDLPVARKARGATPEEAVQEAAAALKEVLLRHAPYLERYTGRTPVMEFHVLARPCGRAAGEPPERHYVRKLSAEEAMVELDLSGEPGMIFYDTATGKPTVLLNLGEGRFRLLEPSPDTAGRAGVETSLDSLRTEARKEPPPGEDEGVRPHAGEGPSAEKYRRIRPRLRCPACKGELHDTEGGLACMECTRRFEIRGGVPVLHIDPDHDPEPRETPVSKNPYGQQTLKMFEKHAEGLVLDCGAGCPPETFGNVIHLEIVRYPGVDVVADGLHLPFADETFDAVVSDIRMPEMDGITATRLIHEKHPAVSIIALTAFSLSDEIEQCRKAGCIEFITKPVMPKVLLDTINWVFEQYHEETKS